MSGKRLTRIQVQGKRIENVRPGNVIIERMDPPGDGQIYTANFAKMPGKLVVREVDLGTCKNHVHINGNACYDWGLRVAVLLSEGDGGSIPEDMMTMEEAGQEIDQAIRAYMSAQRMRQMMTTLLGGQNDEPPADKMSEEVPSGQ